jgi:Ycf66 protein N-terminus
MLSLVKDIGLQECCTKMLAYILAVLVGTGSVGLYIAAFFFPEIHRKHDFIWSGVGFFYALFLWIYARQETGGILVGQTASVMLLGWFAWQTLKLRRQLVPVNQQTPIPNTAKKLQEQIGLKPSAPKTAKPAAKPTTSVQPSTAAIPSPTKISTAPARTPASQPAAPIEKTQAIPNSQISQPTSPAIPVDRANLAPKPQVEPPGKPDPIAEDEAWIKLEVKTVVAPLKPLGTPVQPPTISTSPIEIDRTSSRSPAIIPETISTNVPDDAIQTRAKLDLEDRNNL